MGEKWDSKRGESTYGAETIRRACADITDTYQKPQPTPSANDTDRTGRVDLLPFLNNDSGNADRIIALYGEDLRYCHPLHKWLWWDGHRWIVCTNNQGHRLAKKAMLEYLRQAVEAGSEAHEKFARQSLEARRINSALEMAQCEIFIDPGDLDAEPHLLNFENGIVDLRTGDLSPHDRRHMMTKMVLHVYRPGAKCPHFLLFVYRVMGIEIDEDRAERLVRYLQKAIGYALTGTTIEKAVFILWGLGDNGKTTLLAVLRTLLGDYAGLLQIETIMARREESNNAQADLADLRGPRFVMTSETEENQRLSESKLKRITQGMGTIKAARKYENPIEFPETHKLFIDANHKPVVRGTENAIWNRLHLIPFIVSIPKAEQEGGLGERLISEEAEGILAWVVQGAVTWYRERLGKPPDVQQASEEWREESDVFKEFIEDCCVIEPDAFCKVSDLRQVYERWSAANRETRMLTRTQITNRLNELGCKKTRRTFDKQAWAWEGIGILT